MHAQSSQSCPSLCNSMDCSSPGSCVHGISQAWTLEWVAISFSRGSSWPRDWTCVSCIAGRFFTTKPLGNYAKPLIKPSTKKRECMFMDEHRCLHAQEVLATPVLWHEGGWPPGLCWQVPCGGRCGGRLSAARAHWHPLGTISWAVRQLHVPFLIDCSEFCWGCPDVSDNLYKPYISAKFPN